MRWLNSDLKVLGCVFFFFIFENHELLVFVVLRVFILKQIFVTLHFKRGIKWDCFERLVVTSDLFRGSAVDNESVITDTNKKGA